MKTNNTPDTGAAHMLNQLPGSQPLTHCNLSNKDCQRNGWCRGHEQIQTVPNPNEVMDVELREKIAEEFDDFSYAVMGQYANQDMPEKIEAIMKLIAQQNAALLRELLEQIPETAWDVTKEDYGFRDQARNEAKREFRTILEAKLKEYESEVI